MSHGIVIAILTQARRTPGAAWPGQVIQIPYIRSFSNMRIFGVHSPSAVN